MKVCIKTEKQLQDPHLEIDIKLETGTAHIYLKYTCPSCGGYGCHNKACDCSIVLKPEDVLSTLGPEALTILTPLFSLITQNK